MKKCQRCDSLNSKKLEIPIFQGEEPTGGTAIFHLCEECMAKLPREALEVIRLPKEDQGVKVNKEPTLKEVLEGARYLQLIEDVKNDFQPILVDAVAAVTTEQLKMLMEQNKLRTLLLEQRVRGAEMACKVLFCYLQYLTDSGSKHSALLFKGFLVDFEKNNKEWLLQFGESIQNLVDTYTSIYSVEKEETQ